MSKAHQSQSPKSTSIDFFDLKSQLNLSLSVSVTGTRQIKKSTLKVTRYKVVVCQFYYNSLNNTEM